MSARSKGQAKGATLSAEERTFLDFIARLAVDQALREANAAPAACACSADPAKDKSRDDGNA
jgi:hypothetical protein